MIQHNPCKIAFLALALLLTPKLGSSLLLQTNHIKILNGQQQINPAKPRRLPTLKMTLDLSGGAIVTALTTSLRSGPLGIPALSTIASTALIPLTLYRQGYSFSVGYGLSVALMGACLLQTFPNPPPTGALLATATIFYGVRLALFLLVRELTVKGKREQMKEFDKSPRLNRIPFAVGVGVFYAFMVSPVLYAMRQEPRWEVVAMMGGALAWVGGVLEAVADWHKYLAKKRGAEGEDDLFVGPTSGVYGLVRHPNYLGEVLFWLGVLLGGVPSFGKSPIPWVCGVLGFYGIYSIMTSATKRLEIKQKEKYGGQSKYDDWVKTVRWPLWIGVK